MNEPAPPAASPPPPARRRSRRVLLALAGGLVALVVLALAMWSLRPRLTEEEVRTTVLTTLAREAEASFLVTGTLEFAATVEQANTRRFLPGLLDLDVGTVRATVRVPARVAYGFDVRALRPEDVRFAEDGAVEVALPELAVFSVEPLLERAELRTERGWLRLERNVQARVMRDALAAVRPALRRQAEQHLRETETPRMNAARALVRALAPPLLAAGLVRPRFRVRLGPDAVLELRPAPGAGRVELGPSPEG